jgi:hypothetical protein
MKKMTTAKQIENWFHAKKKKLQACSQRCNLATRTDTTGFEVHIYHRFVVSNGFFGCIQTSSKRLYVCL